ncbi:MAG: hypothetical protein MZV64_18010 [Ignavibacteriales bacterium]|nr:hypothetical protein [Ignavibacteriales bacterium]
MARERVLVPGHGGHITNRAANYSQRWRVCYEQTRLNADEVVRPAGV